MQSPQSIVVDGDDGFDSLDFSGIYHDEAYPSDDEKRKRCAEVLAATPLDILPNLAAIVVRTDADISTMKYFLTRENLTHLIPILKKSDGSGVFFHNFTALQYLDVAPGKISYQLRWTKDGAEIATVISAYGQDGRQWNMYSGQLKPLTAYYTPHALPLGQYRVVFNLEGCFAHESIVQLTLD